MKLKAVEHDLGRPAYCGPTAIFRPWLEFSRANGGMVWAFLDTPLDVCLGRIYKRNGGKKINEQLVRDKHRGIRNVRKKAQDAGERVVDLDWRYPETALNKVVGL